MATSPERYHRVAVCLALIVFFPAIGQVRADNESSYLNTPVFEVLEHFRKQGYPFAYSTNLVPDSLLVMFEPVSRDPLDIVREILGAHGLAIKQTDGIYLVIRGARGPPSGNTGVVLVIIRTQESKLISVPVVISGSPGLRAVEDLGPGIRRIRQLPEGRVDVRLWHCMDLPGSLRT